MIATPGTMMTGEIRPDLRILIVDDSALLRTALRGLLELAGHSAEVVSNGHQALEASARDPYHLVFIDVQMPVMGGFEATRGIRKLNGNYPYIVGMSGEIAPEDAYESAGMDDFLVKPVRMDDLLRILTILERESELPGGRGQDYSISGVGRRHVHSR